MNGKTGGVVGTVFLGLTPLQFPATAPASTVKPNLSSRSRRQPRCLSAALGGVRERQQLRGFGCCGIRPV